MVSESKQEWVNNLCLKNEVINTRNLSKQKIIDWMVLFNNTFNTAIETETFKRYLREGKEYTRESIGLTNTKEDSPYKIIPPTKGLGNILAIGDLHLPFTRVGYLEFCLEMQHKHNCETIVFMGDIQDGHYSSFHPTDPDSPYSGIGELEATRKEVKRWHDAFPNAFCCIGNHDTHSNRKAFNSGLSAQWVKTIDEVLPTPTWTYSDEFIFDGVKYCHGTGRQAKQRTQQDFVSTVQAHYHSRSYIEYMVGNNTKLFACQIGCGIDDKSFAFAYAKHFSKSHINVGIIKDNGTLPIIEYMDLDKDYVS